MEPRPSHAPPSPALVFETLTAHQRTAALAAAIELDVFGAIGAGVTDLPALAARCRASERGMRILCDFLVIIGLLAKDGDRYAHTPTSALFLDPRSPASIASTARFLGKPELMRPFTELATVVRTGRTVLEGQGTVNPDNPVWVEFAHSMAPMMGPMAAPLGQIALSDLDGPLRVLDIAAGHGLFGIEIARQHPAARVVAVDWARVLDVAIGNAERAGVGDRYETLPGSAFEVDFGGPFDIALLTNFLHHFDPDTCIGLLRKVHAALGPRGRVAALEFVPNDDRVSPPMAAAFAMTMLATTASGDAYTLREYEAMYVPLASRASRRKPSPWPRTPWSWGTSADARGPKAPGPTPELSAVVGEPSAVRREPYAMTAGHFVPVPGGSFLMGSDEGQDDERPVHRVWVDAFEIGVYPVTRTQYSAFLAATGHATPREWMSEPAAADLPVIGVSWLDAQAYCAWSTAEGQPACLPTEAEWERAARGGIEGARYPWGEDIPAWIPDGGRGPLGGPWPVTLGPPNAYGVHGITANVHEWCADWHAAGFYAVSPERNPSGPAAGARRVSRGGSWRHAVTLCRTAARSRLDPSFRYTDYGFRVARRRG